MKNEFMIFKEGTTIAKVVICSFKGFKFDRDAKIKKYIWLGYTVYDMDGNEIKD